MFRVFSFSIFVALFGECLPVLLVSFLSFRSVSLRPAKLIFLKEHSNHWEGFVRCPWVGGHIVTDVIEAGPATPAQVSFRGPIANPAERLNTVHPFGRLVAFCFASFTHMIGFELWILIGRNGR